MGFLSKGICNSAGTFLLLFIKYVCGMEQQPVTATYNKILITMHSSAGHCEAVHEDWRIVSGCSIMMVFFCSTDFTMKFCRISVLTSPLLPSPQPDR